MVYLKTYFFTDYKKKYSLFNGSGSWLGDILLLVKKFENKSELFE